MQEAQKGTNLNLKYQSFIEFIASGGMTEYRDDDGALKYRRMTHQEFADDMGVDRRTLYKWRDSIEDFDKRVNECNEKWLGSNYYKVMNTVMGQAMKGHTDSAKLFLRQLRRLEPEKIESKSEVEHSGVVKVEGLDDAELEAKLEQIISQRQA